MQLQCSLALSHIFLTTLMVLLAWTSMVQGAAIDRNLLPAKRSIGVEALAARADASNESILKRDGNVLTMRAGGEILVERDDGGAGTIIDGGYPAVVRTTEETPVDDDDDLSRRWYTLVEIAETEDDDS